MDQRLDARLTILWPNLPDHQPPRMTARAFAGNAEVSQQVSISVELLHINVWEIILLTGMLVECLSRMIIRLIG